MNLARMFVAASAAFYLMVGASAVSATEVDVNALSSTGTTVSLGAGTYDVSEIAGLYTSANLWDDGGVGSSGVNAQGQLLPCATSSTCVYGFRPQFDISIDGGAATQYGLPLTNPNVGGNYQTFVSADAALAAFQAYYASNPITLTLGSASTVSFFIPDTYYADNTGGVSLSVVSAAPEPSVWMLTIAAIGGIGFMLRRSKKTFDAGLAEGISV